MAQILIVDDSSAIRMLMERMLKELAPAADLTKVGSGEEAVNWAQDAKTLSAALIDYNMPGLNGVEVAQALREKFPECILLLCTSNIQDTVRQRATDIQMPVINKPIDKDIVADFLLPIIGDEA